MNNNDNLLYFLKVLTSNYFRTLQIYKFNKFVKTKVRLFEF